MASGQKGFEPGFSIILLSILNVDSVYGSQSVICFFSISIFMPDSNCVSVSINFRAELSTFFRTFPAPLFRLL